MKLPPISDPSKYVGLYVYDFGTHVSVGYTAAEIRMLRESAEYRSGTAYEIYRVHERGGFELRGVTDERLGQSEAICFAHEDGAAARRDYDAIRTAANTYPLPCHADLVLGRFYAFTPSNVTAIIYPASASPMMSTWLGRHEPDVGQDVRGGVDVCRELLTSDGIRIASCSLPALFEVQERSAEEVLRAVNEPLQR